LTAYFRHRYSNSSTGTWTLAPQLLRSRPQRRAGYARGGRGR